MIELAPHQLEGVRTIYRFKGRALLGDEMGLGKTIQTLYWIDKIKSRRPAVIVAPASMKYIWQAEAAVHFNMRTEVLEGRLSKKKAKTQRLPGDVVILNYDILHHWLPVLLRSRIQCLVFDECHYLQSIAAQRTKAAFLLAHSHIPSIIGLSGTPMTNRPIELWSVLHIIKPELFPSREKFAWRYCKPRYTPWGWKYDGATHTGELHTILKQECMIRRLKRDVLPELPDKTRKTISFRLDSYVEYNKAQMDFLGWLRAQNPSRAERASKSQALTKVGYLLRLVARLKLEWTEKWIAEFFESHPGEKLMALTMHTFVIDHLKAKFPNSVVVNGKVTGRKRDASVRQFQSNGKVNLLLGNWKAAGVGITLHAACHGAALDYPWTPGDLLQGEDRLHRIGQKRKVTMFYLTALHTMEEKLVAILKRKAGVLDAVLNGRGSSGDLNIFDELLSDLNRQ